MATQIGVYSMHLEDLLNAIYKLYENTKFFIAGAIGASIVAYYLRDRINTKTEFFIFVLSGAFIAHYLTNLTVYMLGRFGYALEPSNVASIGFLLGSFGGLIIQQIVSYIVSGAWKEISFKQFIIDGMKSIFKGEKK